MRVKLRPNSSGELVEERGDWNAGEKKIGIVKDPDEEIGRVGEVEQEERLAVSGPAEEAGEFALEDKEHPN